MTTRETLIDIFESSEAMPGNRPAFIEALDAHEAMIRQECSGYPLDPNYVEGGGIVVKP